MGQKCNPLGFRTPSNENYSWHSIWYSDKKTFSKKLIEDLEVRKFVLNKLKLCGVSKVVIERPSNKININIHTSKPGVIIGKNGVDISKLKSHIAKKLLLDESVLSLNIVELKRPEVDASIVSQSIAQQLEKRISYRKAVKRSIFSAMKMGAKGIRVNVKGRIGGTDIARMEWYSEGSVPCHTIRANIDYSQTPSYTKDGIVGVKVWVYNDTTKEKNKNKDYTKR